MRQECLGAAIGRCRFGGMIYFSEVHRVEDIVTAVSGHSFNLDDLYGFTVDNSTHTASDDLLDVLPALITFQLRRKWVWVRRHDLYLVA